MQQNYTFGNIELHYNGTSNVLTIVYQGFSKSADFRMANEKILELTQQYQVRKLLVDQRKMGALTTEDIQWLTHSYYPRSYSLLQSHMKTAVLVPEESIFGTLTMKKIASEMEKSIAGNPEYQELNSSLMQNFTTVAEAQAWLAAS